MPNKYSINVSAQKFFVLCIFLLSLSAFSQNTNKFKRRTYSNHFFDLTEKNNLQVESFAFYENNEVAPENLYIPDIKLRYGVNDDLEVFTDIDLMYNKEQQFGLIPLSFGFKVNMFEEKKYFPDIALVTSLQFGKLGSDNYQISKTLPQVGIIINKNLTKTLSAELDYFMQWIDDDIYQTHILDLNLNYLLSSKFSVSTGINYFTDELTNDNFLADVGFAFQTNNTSYSVEYGTKIHSDNLNYFIGIGLSHNFNFNKQKQ